MTISDSPTSSWASIYSYRPGCKVGIFVPEKIHKTRHTAGDNAVPGPAEPIIYAIYLLRKAVSSSA